MILAQTAARRCAGALIAATALIAAAGSAHADVAARPAARKVDAFDLAFPAAGEPVSVHFKARYDDRRGSHDLEVWRQGSERLRRRTDEAIDLHAERLGRDDLQVEVIDHRRRIATHVSREALYRVGHGVEWFSLAHGLARPRTAFTVQPWTGAPPNAAADCRWQRLQQGTRVSAVCWNARLHLPASIVDMATGHAVWTLVSSDTAPIAASVFTTREPGYVQVDADRDIQAD